MHGLQFNIDGDLSRFSRPSLRHHFVGSILAWHATRPLPFLSSAVSPHLVHNWQHAGSRFSATATFWSCIMTLGHCEMVRLARPRHAVRGLMRSYVTRLSGFASSASMLMLQMWHRRTCQRSTSHIRGINKRPHTQHTVCNVACRACRPIYRLNNSTSAPVGQWHHRPRSGGWPRIMTSQR